MEERGEKRTLNSEGNNKTMGKVMIHNKQRLKMTENKRKNQRRFCRPEETRPVTGRQLVYRVPRETSGPKCGLRAGLITVLHCKFNERILETSK